MYVVNTRCFYFFEIHEDIHLLIQRPSGDKQTFSEDNAAIGKWNLPKSKTVNNL